MTTNLKIQIGGKDDIELTPITGSTNSTLTFKLSHNLLAWSNGRFELDSIGFPVNDNVHQNVIDEKISHVEIAGPTSILTTFRNLVLLKDEVKNIGTNAQNEFNFELIIGKDLNNQSDHWNITAEGAPGAKDQMLKLSVADFGGQLDESKIIIDDTGYPSGIYTTINRVEDRSGQKQALLHLEGLLKSLPTKHGVKYSDDPDLNELDLKKGPDVKFIDPSADLGNPPTVSVPVPDTGLWAYAVGTIAGYNNIAEQAGNIKHILFGLMNGTDKVYEDEIEGWIKYLEEIKFILSSIGLQKKSEVVIFLSANGGGYVQGDIAEIQKEPGFYKGFPLIDSNLQALPDPTNKLEVSKKDPNKPVRYTKENIDNLRSFATGYTGSNSDIFTKKTTKNGVQVYANRLPEECLGFQPGDIIHDTNFVYVNGKQTFDGKTKIYYDILSAQNVEEAMDLAFFGKDYDEPQSDKATRKGNTNANFVAKHPNNHLQFNEVEGWNRLTTQEHYYQALKDLTNCKWRIAGDNTGHGAQDAPKYDDSATKIKIDEGYNSAKDFIQDYEKWISVNTAGLNKTQLEEAKTKLEKWKTTRFYTSGGVWKLIIDNFLDEVNGALSLLNDDPDDDVPVWKTELAGLKNRGSELAKKIYQSCQPDQDGFTEGVFEELKKLVKLLEEAHGTQTANTKKELEQFISDSNNDANKKQALQIAKKVKNQDNDSVNCVDLALEKLKNPQEKQLEKTRQKLKSLLAGLKINGKDAYQEIITDIKDSETDINKFIQIWQKCQEIDNATDDDNGELLDALNNFKNDTSNQKAWELVNKYKKDDQSQGYADDLLKKLNDWAEQRKKDYQEIKNAKNKGEFEAAKKEFMKKHEYKNNQKDYDEIYFPLAEKAAEIREKGNGAKSEEKELAELIVLVVSEYSDWKTQLKDLEDKLNKLKKYTKKGVKNNIVEKYSTVQKEALKKLVSKMEEKVKEWKSEKSKYEKNNPSQENPSWYKTPLGIIGIIAAIAMFGGIIYYLVKQNTSEGE